MYAHLLVDSIALCERNIAIKTSNGQRCSLFIGFSNLLREAALRIRLLERRGVQESWTLADRRFGSIDRKFEDLFNFKLDCYCFTKWLVYFYQ